MSKRYSISRSATILSRAAAMIFLLLASALLWKAMYIYALVCFFLFLISASLLIRNSSVVEIDKDGIRRIMLGQTILSFEWKDIREIGVCGLKTYGDTSKKAGALKIYISAKEFSESELSQMILKWPPAGVIYLEYTEDALSEIQRRYTGKVRRFNTGEVHPKGTAEFRDSKKNK